MHSGQERRGAFCVPRCNASPALEMQKSILDQVPKFVECFVIAPLFFSVFPWRYLRFHALFNCLIDDDLTVVAFVCQ